MKVLLVHVGASLDDPLAASLSDWGHSVRLATSDADAALPWTDYRPDVILARLEGDSAKGLDLLEKLASKRPLVGAPVLVTGGNELAVTAARRRFPDASFARIDAVATALASIESTD